MKATLTVVVFFAAAGLLAAQAPGGALGASSLGRSPGMDVNTRSQTDLIQRTYKVEGKVKTLRGDPVRGAKVIVRVLNYMGDIKELKTDEQGEFKTEFEVSLEIAAGFGVDVKVTKRRYLPAHEIVDFGNKGNTWVIPITLREVGSDSDSLSQEDLLTDLPPRLRTLAASDGLSEKAAKDYARGVKEFLDRDDPDRANTYFAEVIKRDAACAACRTLWGLAQLASNDWDGAEHNFTEAIKTIRADPAKARPEPDIAYGVMESWRRDTERAAGFFFEAVKIAPQDPLALQEFGRSQLELENWAAASEYLQKAIAAGAGPDSHLLRAEALLHTDKPTQADQEMTSYLAGRDVKRMPPRVRQIWSQVQAAREAEARAAAPAYSIDMPENKLIQTIPELKGMEPARDQSQLDAILNQVGKNVAISFHDFPNTVSQEDIHQETVHSDGKIGKTQDQEFRYLCLTAPEPSGPGYSEYRADKSGSMATLKGLGDGFMLTSGFTAAALYFHPLYRADARFRYLGKQEVNGREDYVVAFAQHPGKARLCGAFRVDGTPTPTYYQGMAWIDAKTYEIVRFREDLLAPLPQVHLKRQTTEIDFGAVRFKKLPEEFWLPQRVTVAVDWNGKRLRNVHEYSNFELFNVNSVEKEDQRSTPAPSPSKAETGPGGR